MEILNTQSIQQVSGGMNWQGGRESTNVIDIRGKDMGSWIDAANSCWKPGTPSIIMYPGGVYIPNFRF